MIKIKKSKEEEIYSFVIDRFLKFKNTRDVIDLEVEEWIKEYNFIVEDLDRTDLIDEDVILSDAWKSKLKLPVIFTQLKTIRPRLYASIFNNPDYIEITSSDPDLIEDLNNIREYLLSKLNKANFRKKVKQIINDCLMYPAAFIKLTVNDKGEPIINRVSYLDIWCPLTYNENTGFTEIFHRVETNINNLKIQEAKGIYSNTEKVLNTSYPKDIADLHKSIMAYHLGLESVETVDYTNVPMSYKPVELIEWWGKYDINDDGLDEDIIVTIANRQVGIRIDENKLGIIPFFPVRFMKEENLTYGKTLPQLLQNLQAEISTLRNQRLDLLNLMIEPPLKVRRTADISLSTLFLAPGHILEVDEDNDIVPIVSGQLPQVALIDEGNVKQDIQTVSGVTDPLMGIQSRTQTATAVSILTSEAATRIKDYVMDIVDDLIPVIMNFALFLKRYLKDDPMIYRYNAQKWIEFSEDYIKNFDLRINITNIMFNKDLRLQLLLNLLNVIGRLPGINIMPLIRQILELADIKNLDLIIPESSLEVKTKKTAVQRAMQAERKRLKTQFTSQPETRTTTPSLSEVKPVNPQLANVVSNPFIEMIKNLGGKLYQ